MKTTWKTELPALGFILLPLFYVLFIWADLPDTVPLHWNSAGEADRWGSKYFLLFLPVMIPGATYLTFSLTSWLDPRKKIENMGSKFFQLRFWMMLLMSTIGVLVVYSAQSQEIAPPEGVLLLLGLLYVVLGNYFKTIRPNYFIGIRTPWTLENEAVWKKTHQMAGLLWVIGGLLAVCSSLLFTGTLATGIFLSITGVITIIPILYSYRQFKKVTV